MRRILRLSRAQCTASRNPPRKRRERASLHRAATMPAPAASSSRNARVFLIARPSPSSTQKRHDSDRNADAAAAPRTGPAPGCAGPRRAQSPARGRGLRGAIRLAAGRAGRRHRLGRATGTGDACAHALPPRRADVVAGLRIAARGADLAVAPPGRRGGGNDPRGPAWATDPPAAGTRPVVAAPAPQRRTGRIDGHPCRGDGRLLRRLPAGARGSDCGAAGPAGRGVLRGSRGRRDPAADPAAGAIVHDAGRLGRRSGQPAAVAGAGADGRVFRRSPARPRRDPPVRARRSRTGEHRRRGRRRARAQPQGAADRLPVVGGAGILRFVERGDGGGLSGPELPGHAGPAQRAVEPGRGRVLPAAGAGVLRALAPPGHPLPRPRQRARRPRRDRRRFCRSGPWPQCL